MIDLAVGATSPADARLVGLLQEGLRRFPERLANWRALTQLLCGLGRPREALGWLDEALERFPADVELSALRVSALLELDETEAALAAARRLAETADGDPLAGRMLLQALAGAELWDELEAAARRMAWVASGPGYSLEILARRALTVTDRPDAVLAHCDEILARSPGHASATYYRAIALARLGRDGEARDAMGLGRHLTIAQLAAPPGYDDGAFHAALVEEIRANPTLVPDPRRKATRDGLQTRELVQPGQRALRLLLGQIRDAAAAYAAGLDAGDRLARAAPAAARLRAWAVIYGRHGRQKAHLHPSGWLSGVYYVAAPQDAGRHLGALQVGAIDAAYGIEPPWPVVEIEPVPGRLVMFPSYTPHATLPAGVAGERISVAFDVVPRPGAGTAP